MSPWIKVVNGYVNSVNIVNMEIRKDTLNRTPNQNYWRIVLVDINGNSHEVLEKLTKEKAIAKAQFLVEEIGHGIINLE